MKRALLLVVLAALAAQAQEEPTPFWVAPPADTAKPPPKKKKPVQVEPVEIKRKKPPPAEKKKPPPEVRKPKPAPPAREVRKPARPEPEPTWIEPHRKPAPIEIDQQPAPSASSRRPVKPLEAAPEPEARMPARAPEPAPVPERIPSTPPPASLSIVPPGKEPEPEADEPGRRPPVWTGDLALGAWSVPRPDGSGSSWQPAYALRTGLNAFKKGHLEGSALFAFGPGESGSPFVSASTSLLHLGARALYASGSPAASFVIGGGGGATLAFTHYRLQDVNGTPQLLSATSLKWVMEVTAGGRVRVFGGLEARLEVSAMLRDGRLELLPLIGLGWGLF